MVYSYDDYKFFLKDKIDENKHVRGYKTDLAKAAGCQQSFLSHVLHSEVQLTPDHAYGLTQFWNFTSLEKEYFLLIVNLERVVSPSYKKYLIDRKSEIRAQHADITKRMKSKSIDNTETQSIYYSSWLWAALHFLVTIPKYQTAKAMAERLHLPLSMINEHLTKLKELGIIHEENGQWKTSHLEIHLPKNSYMTSMNHSHWRQRAILDSQDYLSDGLHYSALYTLSKRDYEVLRQQFLKQIDDFAKVVRKSAEEEIVVFATDLFKL